MSELSDKEMWELLERRYAEAWQSIGDAFHRDFYELFRSRHTTPEKPLSPSQNAT